MARRAPARRRPRRSTRKGQYRRTSRLAYTKRRGNPRRRRAPARRRAPVRRRRSNPRPRILGTPAFQYGTAAVGGAVVATMLNSRAQAGLIADAENPGFAAMFTPLYGTNGTRLHAGVLGAAATFAVAMFVPKLRAKTKNLLVAAGAGMLTQPAIDLATQLANPPTRAMPNVSHTAARLTAPRQANYNSAVHYNNAAAAFSGVRTS